jgi:hypothetical protein
MLCHGKENAQHSTSVKLLSTEKIAKSPLARALNGVPMVRAKLSKAYKKHL